MSGSRKLYLEYGFLVFLIMLPLLRPGYIFALDMVFTPSLRMPESISNLYLFSAALHLINYVLPSQVIQKVLLFSILLLAGVGAHRLAARFSLKSKTKSKKATTLRTANQWGNYFAGVLYVVNPFTYSRFMAGQYLVLAGYALIPFFILALWNYLAKPSLKTVTPLTLLAILISLLSIHSIFFMALIVVVSLIAMAGRFRPAWKRILGWGVAAVFVWVLAGSYWLLPLAQGKSSEADLIANFDQNYAEGFKTDSDPKYGVVFNAASLYGFWSDRENRYELPKTAMPLWPLVSAVFMGLAALGSWVGWKKGWRQEVVSLAVIGAVALVLGLGIAFKPLAPLYYWMVEHLPLYKGFREPQKFIGLLALVYAVLGAIGVNYIVNRLAQAKGQFQKTLGIITPAIFVILPVIYTPIMLWGFSGQLKVNDYPKDWSSLNQTLNKDPDDFKVLFFPWHQYLSFPFTGTIVANPADRFFDKPVIQGDNIEFGGIFRQESTPETLFVENKVLKPSSELTDGGKRLSTLNVKYIVVAKNRDADRYDFLNTQTDLQKISDSQNLITYLNMAYTP